MTARRYAARGKVFAGSPSRRLIIHSGKGGTEPGVQPIEGVMQLAASSEGTAASVGVQSESWAKTQDPHRRPRTQRRQLELEQSSAVKSTSQ